MSRIRGLFKLFLFHRDFLSLGQMCSPKSGSNLFVVNENKPMKSRNELTVLGKESVVTCRPPAASSRHTHTCRTTMTSITSCSLQYINGLQFAPHKHQWPHKPELPAKSELSESVLSRSYASYKRNNLGLHQTMLQLTRDTQISKKTSLCILDRLVTHSATSKFSILWSHLASK